VRDFTASVAEILGKPGHYRDIKVSRPLPGVRTHLARLDGSPLTGDLRAESVVEGILMTGRVEGRVQLTCARCLEDFEASLSADLCELFVAPGHEVPEGEETYEVKGLEIDLEPMLRDALTLSLPLNPLHAEDCKGLCAHCGKDLNAGECSCVEDDVDPRWAALEGLRDKLEA
jgi:uncharacterized protein